MAGWFKKLHDQDFIGLLKGHDIILLQETWAIQPISLEGYISYSLPAQRAKPKGCLSGGLALLIATHLLTDLVESRSLIISAKYRLLN